MNSVRHCGYLAISFVLLTQCAPRPQQPAAQPSDSGPTQTDATPRVAPPTTAISHAATIALSDDQHWLLTVRPDEDAVAIYRLDTHQQQLIQLSPPPHTSGELPYVTRDFPRSIAISRDASRAWVACERSGEIALIAPRQAQILTRRAVCARPISVAFDEHSTNVIVTCAADNVVLALDGESLQERARVSVPSMPWALVLDGSTNGSAYVTHLHGPGITTISLRPTLSVRSTREIPAIAPRGHRTLAHGKPRSLYDINIHPTTHDLWVVHELHADDTAQPELDFESTVFPAVSIVSQDAVTTLSTDSRLAGIDGAFGDVISGPRHLSFTHQGQYAYVVAQASEDILVIDTVHRVEHSLTHAMSGHWPQGLVWTQDEQRAYVDLRNTRNITEIAAISHPQQRRVLQVLPQAIEPTTTDPMPEPLRLGQRVFFTANDVEIPVTTNHWMACASCHPEGTTDRITWNFTQGPRDTPSNAGVVYGFLFRTADRNTLTQYWKTINLEQGGHFSDDDQILAPYLHSVAGFVQRAIPAPPPPTTDPARVARGQALFSRPDTQCLRCHHGPSYSDSGEGNPSLNLAGVVRVWDVGTCHRRDQAHTDFVGHRRAACAFDTPALRGLAESAPYLHDGSAPTLRDVLTTRNVNDRHGHTSQLTPAEIDDLVEFLRSL